jgi:hypothetical protein
MKKLVVVAVLAVAAVFPAGALAGTFTGVVVGKSGSHLAVASKSGHVRSVSTHTRASVGARVRVNGKTVRVVGRAQRARIQARVTAVGPGTITILADARTFVIAVPGIQFPVSLVGQFVTVDLKLAQDQKDERDDDDQNEDRNEDRNDDQGHHDGGDDHGHHGGDDHGDGDH